MPLGPIVDSHVHLWDPTRFRTSWLDGNDILDKPYGLTYYRAHTQGVDVELIIYLQVEVNPPNSLLEAQWVSDLDYGGAPTIDAIVPCAPLQDGERARSFLEALASPSTRASGAFAACTRTSRTSTSAFSPSSSWWAWCLLPEYDLTFDLCLKHPQLAEERLPFGPATSAISASNIACITAIPAATLIASSPSRAAPAISVIASWISSGRSGKPAACGASARRTVGSVFMAVLYSFFEVYLAVHPKTYHPAGLR